MELENIDQALSGMDISETKALRDKLTKDLQNKRRQKSMKITVYLAGEHRDPFETAKQWAYEKGLTKKPSDWAFAKFALTNAIRTVLDEIELEREAQAKKQEIPVPQQGPNIAKA